MTVQIKNTPCNPCPSAQHDYFTLEVDQEPVLVCRKCGSFVLIKEGVQQARKAAQESNGLPDK